MKPANLSRIGECIRIISILGLIIFFNFSFVYSQNTTSFPLCTPPPVSVNPTSSLICNPGGTGILLTAFGALTYTWSPSTGLTATTGASVTANPASTTTYTVTGTDGVGCTAIATTTVTVANKPTLAPTATPATICSGSNATLNANATMPAFSYCTPTYITGTGSGDYISLVQIVTTTLNNITVGAASPYYTLYPASGSTTGSLVANTAYTMNVKGGIFATCYVRAWIDYNQDGVFTASETIGLSPNVGASTNGTIVFTVPLSAINGATRLRLRSSDNISGPGIGDYCTTTNSAFGETEDYIITITGAVAQLTYLWSPATFLSGTTTNPTTASSVTTTTTYNLTVTSFNGCISTSNVPVTVDPLITVTNPGTTTGTTGTPFSQTFTQTGAVGGATFTINSGTLPTGLSLSATGVLSGTPTQTGSFPITIKVTSGNGCIGIGASYTLVISSGCAAITVTNPVTTTGTAGVAFSQTFTQTGAVGGATFTINTGTLPTGLTLSAAGVLSGTATQTGSFPITVKVTGGNGCIGTGLTYTLVISCQTINITNPVTATGTAGTAFSQTFTQTNAIGGATFTINTGTLPTGLTLSAAGVLSGTATQTGSFPVTVKVTDGNGCIGTGLTYTLVISCQTITVTNPVTATGTAGTAFSQTFTQTNAIGGATFTINTGTLPTGLSLSTAGVLSGTATQTGSFPVTVKVTDGNACIGTGLTYTLVISCQTITVTNPVTATGTAGTAFSQTFTQSGAIGGSTFTINTGTLPTGLTLSAAGVLSGTATQTGSFPITVKVTDGNGCTGIGSTYTLVIGCQTINVTNPVTATGTAGVAFSQTFTQTNAIGGATFTINTGTLPTGLTLSAAGVLSGTATQTGSFPVTVKVTDGNGCIGTGSTFTLVISCQTINVTNPVTATGTAGTAFSQTFTQSGAIGGSTFTINTGTLPTGLTFSTAGVLSGTPTQTGSFPITLKVTDGNGCTGIGSTYTLLIGSTTITLKLQLFLEGYYQLGGAMQSVLNNQGVPLSLATETDTVIIELHHPTTFVLIDSKKGVLLTNGRVSVTFTQPEGSYFISIHHRNTLQTWSANAIACIFSTPLYDFSMAANKAYLSNQVQVEPGVWAFYTGDLNQDEFIDPFDFGDFDTDSQNGVNGVYVATDFNGDGFVDPFDFQVFDANSQNGVTSQHP